MKNIITLSILVTLSLSSYAKTFYIYTSKATGNWDDASTWNIIPRNDGVEKDKFIISFLNTVTAANAVNVLGADDVELQISGNLKLGPSATMRFGINSRIELLATGVIQGNGASQQIYIGNESKYAGNVDKTLTGPSYADPSTASFVSYSLLSVNFINFSGTVINDKAVQLKWSVSNEINNQQYDIEVAINNEWKKIGIVKAHSNAASTNHYQFITKEIKAGTNSFRLKQIDQDGKAQYSNIIRISKKQALTESKIFAANKKITIELSAEVKHSVAVKVMNLNGFVVASQSFQPASTLSLNINHLNAGSYVVYVTDNISMQTVSKIMVN